MIFSSRHGINRTKNQQMLEMQIVKIIVLFAISGLKQIVVQNLGHRCMKMKFRYFEKATKCFENLSFFLLILSNFKILESFSNFWLFQNIRTLGILPQKLLYSFFKSLSTKHQFQIVKDVVVFIRNKCIRQFRFYNAIN